MFGVFMGTAFALLMGGAALCGWKYYLIYKEDDLSFWGLFATILAVISFLPLGALLIDNHEKESCTAHAEEYKVDHRYSTGLGCRFATKDGRFIDSDKWRVND